MSSRKLMIAGMHSGSGKTTLCCGLTRLIADKGMEITVFKTGPDYIDTALHGMVSGRPCINLDPYFLEPCHREAELKAQLLKYAGEGFALIEGAMGYYDGIYGEEPRGSAYSVAVELNIPVILAVDASRPENIRGLKDYIHRYKKTNISGIILNRTDSLAYNAAKRGLEESLNIPLLGYMPYTEAFEIASRHLGLSIPSAAAVNDMTEKLAGVLMKTLDVQRIFEIAEEEIFSKDAGKCKSNAVIEAKAEPAKSAYYPDGTKEASADKDSCICSIGIARDEAFSFIYEDNLKMLGENGARLVFFSPLKDGALPEDIDGLWLPGGYPELLAEELEANSSMRRSIYEAYKSGMPLIAECGGFIYIHEETEGADGEIYKGCGIIKGRAYRTEKLQRFGYIEVSAAEDSMLLKRGESFRSHEFHYWDSENPGRDCLAVKANKSRQWSCIHAGERIFAGFPHIYFRENRNMALRFIEESAKYRKDGAGKEKVNAAYDELKKLLEEIGHTDRAVYNAAIRHWDSIAKPIGGLGELEKLIAKIAAAKGEVMPDISKRAVVVFCADNGIVEEGVSQTGAEVTAMVAKSLSEGVSSVNLMAGCAGADVIPVDIGIAADAECEGLINKKLAYGTADFLKADAMSTELACMAILTGIDTVRELKESGYGIIGSGEMGIGNTTTSSALASVLLDIEPQKATGRGAGLSDEGLRHKLEVIEKGIALRAPDRSNPLDCLAKLGGLDIAGIAGLYLGGAIYGVPVIIDGLIGSAAAAVAYRLKPEAIDYMLPSHLSAEPAVSMIMEELGLKPVINAGLRLGEGTGTVLLLGMLDMAYAVYSGAHSFENINLEAYKRFEDADKL